MRRDIVKALRAIGERKVRLAADGSVPFPCKNSGRGDTAAKVEAVLVSHMVSDGLLARVRGEVSRTDAGRAFLRRALSSAADDGFTEQQRVAVSTVVKDGANLCSVTVNAAESPLAWLATRKDKTGAPMLSEPQVRAGERLASDFARGHQRDRITQSWNVSGVRGSAPRDRLMLSEAAQDARARVERAFEAVGPVLDEVLRLVCCEELGLEVVEKRFGWPARSGKVVLRLALDRLAAHYGIAVQARGAERVAMVHWGAADYCPSA